MLRRILYHIALAAGIAFMISPAYARRSDTRRASDASDRLKADYIFMEAMRQQAIENTDAYYDLLRAAHELNPADTDMGFYLGYYTVMLAGNDSVLFARGYDLMKQHFDSVPSDYNSNYIYATVNDRLGRTDEALRVWKTLDSIHPSPSVSLNYAQALFATQDSANLMRSIDVYRDLESSQGKSIPVTSRIIRTYLSTNDTAAVIGEVHSLLASSPQSADYSVFAGNMFEMFSQMDSALYYYNRACELDSTSGIAYYSKATLYDHMGDSVGYDREVYNALQSQNLDLDTKIELMSAFIGSNAADSTQQPRIHQLFETLLDRNPHESRLHELYASYLVSVNNYDGAAEQLEYSLDIDHATPAKWGSLVWLYSMGERNDKAAGAAMRGIGYFPDDPTLYLMLGSSEQQLKDYPSALTHLRRAFDVADEKDSEMRSQIVSAIGDVYYASGQPDSAFVYYDSALVINPGNLLAMNNCAYFLAEENRDLDRAEKLSAATLQARPDDVNSLDTYAWIQFRKKNFTEAQVYIDKALALDSVPGFELLDHAGDIYFYNGDTPRAVELWERALKLHPDDAVLQKKVRHRTYFED